MHRQVRGHVQQGHGMASDPPLNENQLKAIDLLADGAAKSQVARLLKVHKTTVSGWHKRKKFTTELEKRRSRQENALQVAINSKALVAVEVLSDVMNNPEAKDTDRIRAAGMLLDKARPMMMEGIKTKEVVELACWVSGTDGDGSRDAPEFVDADLKEQPKVENRSKHRHRGEMWVDGRLDATPPTQREPHGDEHLEEEVA